MFRLRCLFVALWMTALLGGCGPEDMLGEQGEERSGQEGGTAGSSSDEASTRRDTVTPESVYSATHSWVAPQEPTLMGSAANQFCFLNRIRGRFDSSDDFVHVSTQGGSWYLGGRSKVEATRALSRCAALPDGSLFSGEYEWTAGQRLPKNLGSASDRVCFLTRVAGRFEDSGHWLRVYVSGGSWFLYGSTGSARARCVPVRSYSAEHSWDATQGRDTPLGSTAGRVCALTYMGGRFDGLNDYIEIYSNAGTWYLGGTTERSGVAAKARCF